MNGRRMNVVTSLRERTSDFSLAIIPFFSELPRLPRDTAAQVLGKQVLRSGTSWGAHFREGQSAKSTADFISKVRRRAARTR